MPHIELSNFTHQLRALVANLGNLIDHGKLPVGLTCLSSAPCPDCLCPWDEHPCVHDAVHIGCDGVLRSLQQPEGDLNVQL
jgi:hypothetical protein